MHFDIMNESNAFENARRTFEKEQDFYQPEIELSQSSNSKLSILDEELLNLDNLHGIPKAKSSVYINKNNHARLTSVRKIKE
jgi:uncharacterized protein YajQ (UPF0234 family)